MQHHLKIISALIISPLQNKNNINHNPFHRQNNQPTTPPTMQHAENLKIIK
jgi:hypothetical protein